jgi:acyl-CoA thioesterase FadM
MLKRLFPYKSHINNVVYNRYAESARVNWTRNFACDIDPAHRREWTELMTPKSLGLILRSIRTDYKFVCYNQHTLVMMCFFADTAGGFN